MNEQKKQKDEDIICSRAPVRFSPHINFPCPNFICIQILQYQPVSIDVDSEHSFRYKEIFHSHKQKHTQTERLKMKRKTSKTPKRNLESNKSTRSDHR